MMHSEQHYAQETLVLQSASDVFNMFSKITQLLHYRDVC